MAGHVHDAEPSAAGQVAEREAELDGDAPAFFLFEAVAVDPGQLAHERGFAVVDVTRRSHYDSHSNASGGRAAARTRASRRAGGNDCPRTPSVPPCGLWASGVSAFESEKNEKAAPGNCRLKARGRAARDAACPVCKSLWKERDGVWGREREAFLQKSSLSLPQVSAICSIRCRCRGCPPRRNPCR